MDDQENILKIRLNEKRDKEWEQIRKEMKAGSEEMELKVSYDEWEKIRDSEWVEDEMGNDYIQILKEDYPDLIILEPQSLFNSCIIGVVERINLTCLCYDVDKIIFALMHDPESSFSNHDEAREHFEFNIQGSFMGENSPVFLLYKRA